MRIASVPAPDVWPTPGSHSRFVEIDLRALTPIYKGGSTTAQVDEGRPFRAPSIRGAIRYWWRAISTIADVAGLRSREQALFGGVHGEGPVASAVGVAVLDQNSTSGSRPGTKPYAFGVTGSVSADYALRQVHVEATGKLRVEWRDDAAREGVQRALKAWLLFGGIGGRSRRGAGSVWWSGGIGVPDSVEAYVAEWRSLVPTRTTKPWPTLTDSVMLVGPGLDTADKAWTEGLDGMRDVRASRDVRATFANKRGPDLLGWKREDYLKFRQPGQFASGRAALGLPIRFQGTKGSFFLNPQGHNRYPSPIHMKVVQLGTKFHPVMLALRGPAPQQLRAGTTNGTLDTTGLDRFLDLAGELPGWKRHP
jgi:CRISPR-associated protein Cmr1